MNIKYLGAPLKEGCTITGADMGMPTLDEVFGLGEVIEVIKKNESSSGLLNHNTVVDFLWRLKRTYDKYKDNFIVTLGGDHSIAIASVSAHYQSDLGLIWIDSHGDCNTDVSSITKRIHGMPLSVLQGLGDKDLVGICENKFIKPENIVLFGISSLDKEEQRIIQSQKIKVFTHQDIQTMGIEQALKEAIAYLGNKEVYISYDLDGIDPAFCKGVNTPVKVGLSVSEALLVLDTLFKELRIIGMDLVEYNPLNDDGNTLLIIKQFKEIIEHYKG